MNIDEKFKSIIKKGNQDSIIPFLKRLTPAEKKALKPVIISQNEHYRETIQKGLITWEMRGSVEQRQMISAAIFTLPQRRLNRAPRIRLTTDWSTARTWSWNL